MPCPAHAVLDINDRGPVLNAGAFALRITNAGILGNAFYVPGLSFDPSLEFPKGSGHECLNHAELWVGGVTPDGQTRVSGGPMLEWRPTLDPYDHVRIVSAGDPGTRRFFDDDGDGKVDEEILNGKDDDGDGLIDEDLGLFSQQLAAADYTDDRPEAVNYGYPNGESHVPLGLSVHQEAYAWSVPGYDRIAGLQFTISNHGLQTLRQLYVGLYADLDSRDRNDPAGHLNDRIVPVTFRRSISHGTTVPVIAVAEPVVKSCITRIARTVPALVDGRAGSGLPAVALLPLGHTLDPFAQFAEHEPGPAAVPAHAPAEESFRFSIFRQDQPPGQGGPPALDPDRYAALAGAYPVARQDQTGDYAVLLSCGPFPLLEPGRSIDFAVAFVVGETPESLAVSMGNAAFVYDGLRRNVLPDSTGPLAQLWYSGATGINGHEVCLEPPPGITFTADPHCPDKFVSGGYRGVRSGLPPTTPPETITETYAHGHCIWTDADCDGCSGNNGEETVAHWLDPGTVPPSPSFHVAAGDHGIRISWDNTPEILVGQGIVAPGCNFSGYRIYKLSTWQREAEVPPTEQWDMLKGFGTDTLNDQLPLAGITDSSLASDRLLDGVPHFRIGRYSYEDRRVQNGFSYIYAVTSVAERHYAAGGVDYWILLESPLGAPLDSIVTPHFAAQEASGHVWVVPDPYRARAPWERPPVPGDVFTRHIDFCGLPRVRCTISIYTVAGDLVAQLDHDGSSGDGQAPWNLISRNGQDIESGIYLFTVESALGHQVGRFVVIR